MEHLAASPLDNDSIKIKEARHHDPFSILGRHHTALSLKLSSIYLMRNPYLLVTEAQKFLG